MTHGISEQEWNDYLEGELSARARGRIEAHLIGCPECWEQYQRMARATEVLRAAGVRVRANLQLDEEKLRAGLKSFYARIQSARAAESLTTGAQIQERLDALAAVMAPLCGSQTARRALHAAAESSPARSLDGVTPRNWEPFLENLTSIAAVMCGATGANLVWKSGQL